MNRIHALAIAGLLAVAAALGLFASTRTAALGASSTVPDAQLQARSARLDRAERQLDVLRAKRPPALPMVRGAAAVPVTLSSSGRSGHESDDDGDHADDHHDGHIGDGRDHEEDD
jgi:hypothetical protein